MRAATVVVAIALGGTVGALALGLFHRGLHSTGTNSFVPSHYVAVVGPGRQACQNAELVPAGSGLVEVMIATYHRPGPPLEVTVGRVGKGSRPGGYSDGFVRVPLSGPIAGATDPAAAAVCVRNRGRSRIAIAGEPTLPDTAATVAGKPSDGRITLRWRAAAKATWWSDTAEVARRVTRGKADLGLWTPLVLVALVWAGALALVLRSARA